MRKILKVISLDRTPQRLERFIFDNAGFNISHFSAIDGATLSRSDCIRNGLIAEDNNYIPGALGIAASHTTLWRQCASGSEPFHIAEDDILLRRDFWKQAEILLNKTAGWDLVLWTHNFDWPVKIFPAPGIGPAVLQYDFSNKKLDSEEFCSGTTDSILTPLKSAAAISCYSISPIGAKKMLRDCLPIGNKMPEYSANPDVGWLNNGLDVEMSRHYEKHRCYIAFPPLAFAPNEQSVSTIRGHLASMHDPKIANQTAKP